MSPLSQTNSLSDHAKWLLRAIAVADACRDIEWYGVGCVIVRNETEIASGFTGESLEGGSLRHAEAVALDKAHGRLGDGKDVWLYSTLEPCSVRGSGKTPCVLKILESPIRRVVYGAREPFDPALGIRCEGDLRLREGGVEVIHLVEFEERCLQSVVSHRRLSKTVAANEKSGE